MADEMRIRKENVCDRSTAFNILNGDLSLPSVFLATSEEDIETLK